MSRNKAILAVIASALLFGFTPILCSLSYRLGNNSFTMTWMRGVFSIPIFLTMIFKNHIDMRIKKKELGQIVLMGTFGTAITTLLLYSSYKYIGVGTTTTLHFMYPLFTTLVCHFVYHDAMSKRQWLALCICLSGVVTFFDWKDLSALQGVLMALCSGLTFSVYLVGMEKTGLSQMNNYKIGIYLTTCAIVELGIVGFATHQIILRQPIEVYGLILCVAFCAQFLAVILLKVGIQYLGSVISSMLSMFEPVSSVIFGLLFLNESMGWMKFVGCSLILGGIVCLLLADKKS